MSSEYASPAQMLPAQTGAQAQQPSSDDMQAELKTQFLAMTQSVERLAKQFPAFAPHADAIRQELSGGFADVLRQLDEAQGAQEPPRYL